MRKLMTTHKRGGLYSAIREQLLRAGQGFCLRFVAFVGRQARYHSHKELERRGLLAVGRHTYGIPRVDVYRGSEARVTIGSFCSLAPGVTFITGGIHPRDWVSTYPFRIFWKLPNAYRDGMPATRGDIVIGSDVWLGTDTVVLSGVTIGHGAIVAARAVVTRDIPPYAIVAGAPARVVGHRFSPEQVERLMRIRWWDWTDEQVGEAVSLLSSPEIDRFLEKYD